MAGHWPAGVFVANRVNPEMSAVTGKDSEMTALNTPVLVLNQDWTAIKVISLQRAIKLLMKDIAQVVEVDEGHFGEYDFESWAELSGYKEEFERDQHQFLRGVSFNLAVPRIIRLLTFKRAKTQRVKLTRSHVYSRDNYTCQYCGKRFKSEDLNLDHVTPSSKGGKTKWDNIVCSCIRCNTRKANRSPTQAGMNLIREPYEPRPEQMHLMTAVRKSPHDSWKQFVDAAYWNTELKD